MKLAVIGGAGLLGSTAAFCAGGMDVLEEIRLLDIRYGRGSSGLYGSNQESSGNLMKNDRAVIKWRAEHEGSSIFPWYRVSL